MKLKYKVGDIATWIDSDGVTRNDIINYCKKRNRLYLCNINFCIDIYNVVNVSKGSVMKRNKLIIDTYKS